MGTVLTPFSTTPTQTSVSIVTSTSPVIIPTGSNHISFGAIIGISVASFIVVLICIFIVARYAGWTWWSPTLGQKYYQASRYAYNGIPQSEPKRPMYAQHEPTVRPSSTSVPPVAQLVPTLAPAAAVVPSPQDRNCSFRRLVFVPRGGKVPPGARKIGVPVRMTTSPSRVGGRTSEQSYNQPLPSIPQSAHVYHANTIPSSNPLPQTTYTNDHYGPSEHNAREPAQFPVFENLPMDTGPVGHLGPYPDLRPGPSHRSGYSLKSSHHRRNQSADFPFNDDGGPPSTTFYTYTGDSDTASHSKSRSRSRSISPETGSYISIKDAEDIATDRNRSSQKGYARGKLTFSRHIKSGSLPGFVGKPIPIHDQEQSSNNALGTSIRAIQAVPAHHLREFDDHGNSPYPYTGRHPSTIQEVSEPSVSEVSPSHANRGRVLSAHSHSPAESGAPLLARPSVVSHQGRRQSVAGSRPNTSDRRTTIEDDLQGEDGKKSVASSSKWTHNTQRLDMDSKHTWAGMEGIPKISVISPTPVSTDTLDHSSRREGDIGVQSRGTMRDGVVGSATASSSHGIPSSGENSIISETEQSSRGSMNGPVKS